MSLHAEMLAVGQASLEASRRLAVLGSRRKNAILEAMAEAVETSRKAIAEANAGDVQAARAAGMAPALVDRLTLTDKRIDAMIAGIREVAALKDPVGHKISRWIRPNGLEIVKRRVPIGVIAIIYESRPNVTADTAALCIKTSNAVILRGGKEAINSNRAIADAMAEGGRKGGLPENAIQLIRTTDREAVRELVRLDGIVDMVIPRGGESLIRAVVENATVPVLKHYKGICATYVDESADVEMALRIVENAKCQRPGTCNATETLLVHEAAAKEFLPRMAAALMARGVELRGDAAARAVVADMKAATDRDWDTEFLDMVLAVGVVPSLEAAIAHINRHGSHHSDAIITESENAARRFCAEIDSAAVYVNASTRFTDGGEFGMGAEIGISTDKLHARGPMGLEELTTYKYVVTGNGQVRT
ncbi:MAG: glutamate-5-semialdehyde dehydrogenase [Lentisphaerae bacterium]|nr:glutamate-5-semialdehyde dehydrogenase [Lentisphaerota bacterium]